MSPIVYINVLSSLITYRYTETYDCPRITSTPPPCPSATSTNAGIAPTSSSSHDTTSTPQPTSVPPVTTEPSGSMVTTVATTELVTEESITTGPVTEESLPTDPVTDDSTSPGQISGKFETISVAPAPTLTEQPVDPNTPTQTMLLIHQNVSNPQMSNIVLPLIIGTVSPLLVLSVIVVITASVYVCSRSRANRKSVHIMSNPSYIVHSQRLSSTTPNIQHAPAEVNKANDSIELTENDAYAVTSGSNANGENNDTSIENIATEKNEAYGTIVTDSGTTCNDSCYYDYI